MNECTKPHPMLHTLFGLGLGFVLLSYMPSLGGTNGLLVGFALILAGFVGDALLPKPKTKKAR